MTRSVSSSSQRAAADYVVVGGGTAGAVVARRLADAGAEVELLEQGPAGDADPRVLELARAFELFDSEYVTDYAIQPQERGNGDILLTAARLLGGCSSHNGCVAFRAPDWDLTEWESLGAAGWGPKGTRAAFDRVIERLGLEDPATDNACQAAFVAAACQSGLPPVDFAASSVREGAGWLKLNKRGAIRRSSAVAYLFPLAGLPTGLRVSTGERVDRIVLDQEARAIGVRTATRTVRARAEVIVCGGAIASAQLLLLSGIGPADHLASVGVGTQVDLPGVGANLVDHPEGIVLYEPSRPIPLESTSHVETATFHQLEPSPGVPEIQIMFVTATFDKVTTAHGYPTAAQTFSMHPNVARPRSRGTVRLASADPLAAPRIDPRYYTDPEGYDERTMLEGIRLCRRIAEQPALAAWTERELAPGPTVQDAAELSAYVRGTGTTVYHWAGTCRMGDPDDELAVVDPLLRVRRAQGLRVADASVFPSLTTVNPCITVMMIGERCAEMVLESAS